MPRFYFILFTATKQFVLCSKTVSQLSTSWKRNCKGGGGGPSLVVCMGPNSTPIRVKPCYSLCGQGCQPPVHMRGCFLARSPAASVCHGWVLATGRALVTSFDTPQVHNLASQDNGTVQKYTVLWNSSAKYSIRGESSAKHGSTGGSSAFRNIQWIMGNKQVQ